MSESEKRLAPLKWIIGTQSTLQGEKVAADRKAEVAAKAPARALRAIEKAKARAVERSFALNGVTAGVTWGINVVSAIISLTVRRATFRDSGAKVRAWHPW